MAALMAARLSRPLDARNGPFQPRSSRHQPGESILVAIRFRTSAALLLLALSLTGCAQPETPIERAQAFWDAVTAGRSADAIDYVVPGDRQRQLEQLGAMDITAAQVERLEVPPEARIAMLPTRVRLAGDEELRDAITVLRRSGELWLVDLDATRTEMRSASVAAVGERLEEAAERLRESLGRELPELASAIEQLGRELGERIGEDTRRQSDAMADDLGRTLEQAGEALVDGLEKLERALRRPDPAVEPAPSEDAAEPERTP